MPGPNISEESPRRQDTEPVAREFVFMNGVSVLAGLLVLYILAQCGVLFFMDNRGFLERPVFVFSILLSVATVAFLAYTVRRFHRRPQTGAPDKETYRLMTAVIAGLLFVSIIHAHLMGSQNSLHEMLVLAILLVVAWFLRPREFALFFVFGNLLWALLVLLEFKRVVAYAPLFTEREKLFSVFLDWRMIVGQSVNYLLVLIACTFLVWRIRGSLDRTEAALRQNSEERRRAEEDLRRSRDRLNLALASAQMGAFEWDIINNKRFWDDQTHRLLGFEPGTYSGEAEDFFKVMSPDDRAEVEAALARAVEQGAAYETEYRAVWPDGSVHHIVARGDVSYDHAGRAASMTGVCWDVTERKRAEEEKILLEAQLRHQQKLESLGTLASGVAHEINNPLTGILNFAELIKIRASDNDRLTDYAERIVMETMRVAQIVQNLLAFARDETSACSPARLIDIVDDTLTLTAAALRQDKIELTIAIPDDLPRICCRQQQIQQVLMNLLTNARDALNERYPGVDADKTLTIAGARFAKDGKPWVRLTVENHGPAIPPEIIDRIFDPFFTTKPRDRVAGLGLSVSYGIVAEHGGSLTVESDEVRTQFHVDLPAEDIAPPAAAT